MRDQEPSHQDSTVSAAPTDVVVVGAGIAGLHAASLVADAGRSVVVLEASGRVGGRLRSTPDGADLGATWFWPGEQRVASLVAKHAIATHSQYLDGDAVYHAAEGAQRVDGNPLDVPSRRFVHGAESLAAAVAASLPSDVVRLLQPVSSIRQTNDRLAIDGPASMVTAQHVIIAIPPALAAQDISFDPPLPDRLAQLISQTPVWMGGITKVVARYDRPFWRDQGLAGSGISHIGPVREFHDMSGPDGAAAALFGFVSGQAPGSATATHDEVLAQLIVMFGPDAGEPVELIIQDWRQERHTTPAGAEQLANYQTYGHPDYQHPTFEGRLHWASTETGTVSPGHIEGALQAAERAVDSILAKS